MVRASRAVIALTVTIDIPIFRQRCFLDSICGSWGQNARRLNLWLFFHILFLSLNYLSFLDRNIVHETQFSDKVSILTLYVTQ